MIEFASFCYLQNQKTGCTMVETFLRQHCSEDIVRYEKHKAPLQWKNDKVYLISVREPLDSYLSLFNYGLDGKGEMFGRLRSAGKVDLYANGIGGFGYWLEFLLDPANARLIYPSGCGAAAPIVGLVSCRFLRLATAGFEKECARLGSRAAFTDFLTNTRMVDKVIRYENLQNELMELVNSTLSHVFIDRNDALKWLAVSPRINSSNRRENPGAALLTAAQRALLIEREWYLYQNLYSEAAGRVIL